MTPEYNCAHGVYFTGNRQPNVLAARPQGRAGAGRLSLTPCHLVSALKGVCQANAHPAG